MRYAKINRSPKSWSFQSQASVDRRRLAGVSRVNLQASFQNKREEPDLRYLGGKSRLAKSIRDVILSRVENTDVTYWEPFVGGCGSFEVIAPEFKRAVGSDIHPDLILMWQSVMDGWIPPTDVSPEQYQELRDSEPSALRGFVGFGGLSGVSGSGVMPRGVMEQMDSPETIRQSPPETCAGRREHCKTCLSSFRTRSTMN